MFLQSVGMCLVVRYTVKHPRRTETSRSHSCMCVQQVVKYEFNWKLAFKKIVGGTMITEIRNVGTFLYKVGCKWEYHAKNSLGG